MSRTRTVWSRLALTIRFGRVERRAHDVVAVPREDRQAALLPEVPQPRQRVWSSDALRIRGNWDALGWNWTVRM